MLLTRRHPDKNGGSEEATEKFKQISAAIARLTTQEKEDDDLDDYTPEDIFTDDLFQEFSNAGVHPFFFM